MVVKHVAGGAGALEEGAAVTEIGFGEHAVGEEAFELGDVGVFVGGGLRERAPEVDEGGADAEARKVRRFIGKRRWSAAREGAK
jgi:hypothetical protein